MAVHVQTFEAHTAVVIDESAPDCPILLASQFDFITKTELTSNLQILIKILSVNRKISNDKLGSRHGCMVVELPYDRDPI